MKITRPLDKILNTEVKVKALRFFCRTGHDWNGTQIAKEIGVTPAAAHSALRELVKERIVHMRNMGNSRVYSLDKDNYLVANILAPLFDNESKILDSITEMIRREISRSGARGDILSVSLFGSVNAKEDHSASDIDLAVIVKGPAARSPAEKLFHEIDAKISRRFGNVVSPYISTLREFRSKRGKGMDVIMNMIKSNTLIYGESLESII